MQNCELVDVLTQPGWAIAIGRVAIEPLEPEPLGSEPLGPEPLGPEPLGPETLELEPLEHSPSAHDISDYFAPRASSSDRPPAYGYRCWVFTPDFTVLDDGEIHHSREAAANSARRLVLDSREY